MFACYRTFVENCSSQTFEMLGGIYQSDPTPKRYLQHGKNCAYKCAKIFVTPVTICLGASRTIISKRCGWKRLRENILETYIWKYILKSYRRMKKEANETNEIKIWINLTTGNLFFFFVQRQTYSYKQIYHGSKILYYYN